MSVVSRTTHLTRASCACLRSHIHTLIKFWSQAASGLGAEQHFPRSGQRRRQLGTATTPTLSPSLSGPEAFVRVTAASARALEAAYLSSFSRGVAWRGA